MSNIEVIGIDHGWLQIKTATTCINTSINELPNEPAFHDNVLEYEGRYFAVGDGRLDVLDSDCKRDKSKRKDRSRCDFCSRTSSYKIFS